MGRTRDVASHVFETMAHLASREKQKGHAFTYTHTYVCAFSKLKERTVMGLRGVYTTTMDVIFIVGSSR